MKSEGFGLLVSVRLAVGWSVLFSLRVGRFPALKLIDQWFDPGGIHLGVGFCKG